jgi:thymidylate synthase (FAD)
MSSQIVNPASNCVELLEVFGSDLTVVNAARVSMGKVSTELTEVDKKLIRYLSKHKHNSPFYHPQIRFRIKMPIFIAREWYRHSIGFARNEISRRYVDTTPEFYMPSSLRERNPSIKQGSKETSIVNNDAMMAELEAWNVQSANMYNKLMQEGVAPEVARIVLPQSMHTEFIETASLYAYARLCELRNAPDAQKEIRDYAQIVSELLEKAFPVSWAALIHSD